MVRTAILSVGAAVLLGGGAAAEAQEIVLSSSGRTLAVSPGPGMVITIEPDGPALCVGVEPGVFKLKLAESSEIAPPRLLAGEGADLKDRVARIASTRRDAFVIYNIVRLPVASESQRVKLDACLKLVTDAQAVITSAKAAAKTAADDAAAQDVIVSSATDLVAQLRKSAELYQGSGTATAQIEALIEKIATAENALEAARAKARDLSTIAKTKEKAYADAAEGKAALETKESRLTALKQGALLKVGVVATGKFKSVFYDFQARRAQSGLQLNPFGPYPTVRFGDQVFVTLANVQPAKHSHGFFLNATAHAGVPVDIEPVRPMVGGGESKGVAGEGDPLITDQAYVDVVLPLRDAYAPNEYPEVTITTEESSADESKKLTTVTLVDKAKFPQFRALYRYNFNTGVIVSNLRDSVFQKVRVAADDPATEKIDESRYDTEPVIGARPLKPVFAVTYYLKPVDIQAPVGNDWVIPNPTIGFAFGNPADNMYLGFSHEIRRNAQLFWGWHFGKTAELLERNTVTEPEDASDPKTHQVLHRAFSVGVTFNFSAITKIFK